MINVLIVEDSQISSETIENRLKRNGFFNIRLKLENAANAEIACMRGGIDLILMDICTADDESGLDAAEKIKRYFPKIKIIIMTSMPEWSFIERAKEVGIDSFWYKEYGDMDLCDVCVRTMKGEHIWPNEKPVVSIGNITSDKLSEREVEIIRLLAKGFKQHEIAKKVNISENTVKYHIKNLLADTGFRNTTQLVANVVQSRLIMPNFYDDGEADDLDKR